MTQSMKSNGALPHGRFPRTALVLAFALSGLLAVAPARALHPNLDLDRRSAAQIDALLQAELDDEDLMACGLSNPRAPVADEEMLDIIMCALGDEGDDDAEDDMDIDDLEAEMNEAGQSLQNVVAAAIDRADTIAQGGPLTPADMRHAMGFSATGAEPETTALDERYVLKDGRINPGKAAVPPVKQYIRQVIQAR